MYMIKIEYVGQFLLGGILMTLLYHFSLQKNTVLCALIPALPVLFLIGLFYNVRYNSNIKKYILYAAMYIMFYLAFLGLLLLIFHYNKNIIFSTLCALIIYCVLIVQTF